MKLLPTLRGARLQRDLIAALSLAAIAIPEQLATARLAGMPAAQGLAVFAAASLVALAVSRHRTLSVGADSTIAPVVAVVVAGSAAGSAALLALMLGLVLTGIALARLEWIANLLSKAVAAGMLTGIAVHILAGLLPNMLGLHLSARAPVPMIAATFGQIGAARFPPLAMTLAVASVCLLSRRYSKRLPGPLFAMAAAIAVAVAWDPAGHVFMRVPAAAGALGLAWPAFDAGDSIALLPATLSLSFLCLSQTVVVLRQGGSDSGGTRRDALGTVGVANLAAAAIGSFPVDSSPPRTALLRMTGATSQLAGFGAALTGLALVLLGGKVLAELPAAALAGVLVYIAIHLLESAGLPDLLRRSRAEGLVALATAALVVLLPLQVGLPLAIIMSLAYATMPLLRPAVVELDQVPGTTVWWHRPEAERTDTRGDTLVLGLSSPINFANADTIAGSIRTRIAQRQNPPKVVVLECAGVLAVDLTGADLLGTLIGELRASGIRVALARLESDRAQRDLEWSGFLDKLGRENLYRTVAEAAQAGS
ncbi:MAG: SulP family inorganic anion transporter [Novosphingobium sp.]|nr:SulP family inorganic anion transporter [Novosphingobium sp.]